jgi:hypothetical protein
VLESARLGQSGGARMKNHFCAAVLLAALIGSSAAQSVTALNSSNSSGMVPQGTALVAELAKSIDARKARAGDTVKAKVTQDVLANGQIVIQRGSRLLGHVTEAKAFSQDAPQSRLGVVFDRVALKDGKEVSLNGVLQALAPPVEAPDVLSASSSSYGGGNPGGSQPVSRGASRLITVDPRDRIDHTRDDALRNAADPNSYGRGVNTLPNGKLGSGNRGVFGIPGLSLKPGPSAPEQELVSTKANIKLESGTQMVLETTSVR